MANNWIQHVKQTQQKHNCSYKEALQLAKQTYKTGGNLKTIERQFKNFGRKAKRDLEKINPFNNKQFNRAGAKMGKITNDELLPATMQIGSEVYKKGLQMLDPFTMGTASSVGNLLYQKAGAKYIRQPKNKALRGLSDTGKMIVKYAPVDV